MTKQEEYWGKRAALRRYRKFVSGIEDGIARGIRSITGGLTDIFPARRVIEGLERELGIKEEPEEFVTEEKLRQEEKKESYLARKFAENERRYVEPIRGTVAKIIRELKTRGRELAEKTEKKLETGIWWGRDLLRGIEASAEDTIDIAAEYADRLRRRAGLVLIISAAFGLIFIFRNKLSATGYSVMEFTTGNASFLLIFILALILIGFYKLNKK